MVLRHLEIVSDTTHLEESKVIETINQYKTIKEWAYILHDKDKDKEGKLKNPHYHIYLWFEYPVHTEMVAQWFGLKKNFIKKIQGRKKDILLYLTHKNAPEKFQYPDDQVKSNFDLNAYIIKENKYERLSNFGEYSYAQHITYIYENFKDKDKIKAHQYLKDNWLLHCEYLETKGDRKMKVIFINGVAGSGKTTYAKKIADAKKMDYYVSSSNNDALGGYKGQKVLILDDARDSTFSFNDFLKLLDNHTSSSVRSRYNNKVFNGEIIIITSVVPLAQWYSGIDSKISAESKVQLYRRINEYYEMDKKTIKAYPGLNDNGMPNLLKEVAMPNFISAMFEDLPSDTLSIFSETMKLFEKDDKIGPLIRKKFGELKKTKFPF